MYNVHVHISSPFYPQYPLWGNPLTSPPYTFLLQWSLDTWLTCRYIPALWRYKTHDEITFITVKMMSSCGTHANCKLSYYFQYESYHSIPRTSHIAHAANVATLIATHVAVTECSWDHVAPDLVPRPHRLKRKMVWWLLSNLLVVPTQQYWFQITCLHDVRPISLVYAHAWKLDDVAQFQWIVQNQDCWLSTTKKLLNSHQTLFLVRGWGLGTRLCSTTLQEYRLGCGLG